MRCSGWNLQSDVAISGKGTTQSIQIESFAAQDRLFALISDSNSNLFAAEYDGATWTITNGGAALESALSAISGAPFAVSAKGD